jgi:pyruvate dehydrogenase E2 component (dihydrolipoamide acetyltransferase)
MINMINVKNSNRWSFPRKLSSGPSSPEYNVINMPALSPTMEAGVITKWHKEPGAALSPQDILCDVETDKATVAFEIQDEGVLAKVLVPAGSGEVKVGMPVAVIVEDSKSYEAFKRADESGNLAFGNDVAVPKIEASSVEKGSTNELSTVARTVSDHFLYSPAARHILESTRVDATGLKGSGRGGRITKADLIRAMENSELPKKSTAPPESISNATPIKPPITHTTPVKPAEVLPANDLITNSNEHTDIPANNIRKVIAKRLAQSKATVPHLYLSIECELDPILDLRKNLAKKHDAKVSVNDLVIRAAALALRDVPEANFQWSEKEKKIIPQTSIDISIAVATPTGLITPIITRAIDRGLIDISSTVKDLASRAKENKLKPEEFQGGTFTISNLGMFGIDEFSAVINLPQACILAVGSGSKRVVPGPVDSEGKRAPPKIATVMTAKLSCDRRVVDESIAAKFSKVFQTYMQKPELMLL